MGAAIESFPAVSLDLGSGGGLPGLPLALAWPTTRWLLLDANARRADFLRHAASALDLSGRVEVIEQRAELAGRGQLRSTVEVVMARSFAAPAVTAECAAPFLHRGGLLVVAEPPEDQPDRWDGPGLASLGMQLGTRVVERSAVQVIVQVTVCPDRFPRRVGVPSKRPLF